MRYLLFSLLLLGHLAHAELAETDWLELMPLEDQIALQNMPEIEHIGPELESDFYQADGLRQRDDNLPDVMYSAKTVAALDGKAIRLGGYPVPLETDASGNTTEFFLVPYPGACIHVPPPPPNQLVLVRYAKGIPLEDIYSPLWVSGILRIENSSNDLADSAYAMNADSVRLVDESDL